jgi:hypothetical protein
MSAAPPAVTSKGGVSADGADAGGVLDAWSSNSDDRSWCLATAHLTLANAEGDFQDSPFGRSTWPLKRC